MYTYICIHILYLWSYINLCTGAGSQSKKYSLKDILTWKTSVQVRQQNSTSLLPTSASRWLCLQSPVRSRPQEGAGGTASAPWGTCWGSGAMFFLFFFCCYIFFQASVCRWSRDRRHTGSVTWHDMFFSSRSVFQLNTCDVSPEGFWSWSQALSAFVCSLFLKKAIDQILIQKYIYSYSLF